MVVGGAVGEAVGELVPAAGYKREGDGGGSASRAILVKVGRSDKQQSYKKGFPQYYSG